MSVTLTPRSSNTTFFRSTPGMRSADTAYLSEPSGSGSGESPGSAKDVVPSKIVIAQRRWPSIVCSSALCTVAPVTGENENMPAVIAIADGGGSQPETAVVADGSTPRSQVIVDGSALVASS